MNLRIKSATDEFCLEIDKDTISIGRSSDNDFSIPLNDFSRRHCLITIKGDYIFIMDIGSKNGVMIDGKRIPTNQQYPIYSNSKVVLANYFQLILPEGTAIKEFDPVIGLDLSYKGGK